MPRYYLHIWKAGSLACEDPDGAEFSTLEDAYLEAFASAGELWHELIGQQRDPRQYSFVIAGAGGAALTELPFREVLESCRPVVPQRPVRTVPDAMATKEATATKEAFLDAIEHARHVKQLSVELSKTLTSVRETISVIACSPGVRS